jgi:hypothetical protein
MFSFNVFIIYNIHIMNILNINTNIDCLLFHSHYKKRYNDAHVLFDQIILRKKVKNTIISLENEFSFYGTLIFFV